MKETISIREFNQNISKWLNKVYSERLTLYLTNRGTVVATISPGEVTP